MGEHLNDNLAALREQFGAGPLYPREEGDRFTVDGVEFVCDYAPGSTAERFSIVKPAAHAALYRDLCRSAAGRTVVELGIAEGGSTALMALLGPPERLVAVDLEPVPVTALSDFIERRGLSDVVRPRYGVDQSDRQGLAAAVDGELGGRPIDLVIDDASHILGPTTTSFETLFPRLRPGGRYLIEDWRQDIIFRDALIEQLRSGSPEERAAFAEALRAGRGGDAPTTPVRPLADLVVALVLACASRRVPAIESVQVSEHWTEVVRGPAELDPVAFRLSDLYHDHFGYLG